MHRPFLLPSLSIAIGLLVGCGGSSQTSDKSAASENFGSDATNSWVTTDTGSIPPEEEDDAFFKLPPAQTPDYVFVANPTRNTVTRVNVQTLAVDTSQVGINPQLVQTTDDYQTAVVFNSGEDSVSILDIDTMAQSIVPVRDNMNAMRLSPGGQYAVLWHDADAESPDESAAGGLQSFNEASFVDLDSGAHFPMAVGFNPRDVMFSASGEVAVVVSDEYLAIVQLDTQPLVPSLIRLTDEIDPPEAEEVVVTPDGRYAFVRQFGADEVLVVDLVFELLASIPVGLNPTDLDLSPDGTQVVVVSRAVNEIWVIEVADPFLPPNVVSVPGELNLGALQLDSTGAIGVLYTTSAPVDRYAVWDRATDEVVLHALIKPVDNLTITPNGSAMLVFHTKSDTPEADPFGPFFDSWALTAIDLEDFRNNPLKLPAEPIGFANSAEGDAGYFIMDNEHYLERLDYTTLLHDEIPLKSPPVFVGVLPDLSPTDGIESFAWVSQEHDLGRISFYDPQRASLETITGFELNSEIEN
ncbi:MAG: hypothetical protein GWP91_14070 [Rhodobacterales bacterium]|nr:hypothetical protein [Rhodobacterales bacterium]